MVVNIYRFREVFMLHVRYDMKYILKRVNTINLKLHGTRIYVIENDMNYKIISENPVFGKDLTSKLKNHQSDTILSTLHKCRIYSYICFFF